MAGSLNSDSVIWVAGDSTGKDFAGRTVAVPKSEDYTASGVDILAELNALEAKLTASGILPAF